MPDQHLRLVDVSDIALLAVLERVGDEEGWASSVDVAGELALDALYPARNVGSRLGWLRRYGAVERDGGRWRMTAIGHRLYAAALDGEQLSVLDRLSRDDLLAVTHWLADRMPRVRREAASLIRREFKYGEAQYRFRNEG